MVLDTCALVWLVMGSPRITAPVRRRIADARDVLVCAITAFEIGCKYAQGGIDLPCDPERWYAAALERHGLTEVPVDGRLAIAATKLPRIHKDPCDRFVIAAALMRRLPVVTADPRFAEYGVVTMI